MISLSFDTVLIRERGTFVAWTPQLDVSSCGDTPDSARQNLKVAVRLFLEEAGRKGTLAEILDEAGYPKAGQAGSDRPRVVSTETMDVEVGV
jgi:predicted RNase H-like HicB family nuclease